MGKPQPGSKPFLLDETAKCLLAEYDVPSSADDSRDKTMNSLMYFLGIGYQVSYIPSFLRATVDNIFSS